MRRWWFASVLALNLVGCGLTEPGQPSPQDSPATRPNPGASPQLSPNLALVRQAIGRDVAAAYQAVNSLAADYEEHQTRGSEHYDAVAHLRFARPRRVRIEVKTCTDPLVAGASILWVGGRTLKGKKSVGPFAISQEHALAEKPNLRGWTFDQTDYDAMVQSLLAGLPQARVIGTTVVGGRSLYVVEFASSLKGAAIERIGLDPALRLPVYREVRERSNGPAVATRQYTNVVLNPTLTKDAFTL